MRPNQRRIAVAIFTAVVLAALMWHAAQAVPLRPGAADVPPEWPMFGGTSSRNLVNPTARNLPVEWSTEDGKRKNIKWVADLGSKAYGGPSIAGGKVFVGTNNESLRNKTLRAIDLGVIMCFAEVDGKFLWHAVHAKLPAGQVNDWPFEGIASTPTIEGDRLYYVSNRCEVVCANVNTGKPIWTLDMIKELGVFPHNLANGSPLLVDDTLYVVTSNGVNEDHAHIPAPQAPSFLAVNKRSGKVLWQNNAPTAKYLAAPPAQRAAFFKELVSRGELLMHGQWSNPAYGVVNGDPQVIFPGGDGWIRAFTPAGKLLWQFDCNPKAAKWNLKIGERSDFIGTPVVYKDRVYIAVGQDPEHRTGVGHLWCIDMTKRGDVSAEIVVNGNIQKNPNSAAVWHYGGEILNKEEKRQLRRNFYFGRSMSTCAVHDDLVYAADIGGIVHCLDANTGKVHWEHDTRADLWSSPFVADGKMYIGTDDAMVLVFEHGKQKKLLAENEMDGRIRTAPVAVGSVLYVLTENKLYAIAKE